jgi:hypothetical protein
METHAAFGTECRRRREHRERHRHAVENIHLGQFLQAPTGQASQPIGEAEQQRDPHDVRGAP